MGGDTLEAGAKATLSCLGPNSLPGLDYSEMPSEACTVAGSASSESRPLPGTTTSLNPLKGPTEARSSRDSIQLSPKSCATPRASWSRLANGQTQRKRRRRVSWDGAGGG